MAKKKVLFYSIYHTCEPVFASELEVMDRHIKQGDEVYVLRCHGELRYCDLNPEKRTDICKQCNMSFYQNIKLIDLSSKNVLRIPAVELSYDQIPTQFKDVDELKNFTLEGIKFGLCTASTIISEYREHRIDMVKHREKIYRLLKTSYYTYKFMQKVFADLKPDVFYHQGGRVANIYPTYKLAEKLGIERYSVTDAGLMTKYELFKNFTPFDFVDLGEDMVRFWQNDDSQKVAKATKWFTDKKNGLDVEWASFTKDQQKNLLPEGFNSNKHNIAIFNSSINEYNAVEEAENPIYHDETEALQKLFEHYKNDNKIHFYLRIHPNLKNCDNTQIRDLKVIAEKKYENLTIVWPEEKIDTYALLHACDKVIVFFSTVGVEACFWGKPSILAGRAIYEGLDCCYKPKTHEEFMALVKADLKPKDQVEAIKYAYWQYERGFDFKYYKPDSHFGGSFKGQPMSVKMTRWDKIDMKFKKRTSKLVRKLAKFLARFGIL